MIRVLSSLVLGAATAVFVLGFPCLLSSAESFELKVLSYNVHGLPAIVARDDPGTRSRKIGPKLRAYDLVLLQEDFDYSSVIHGGAKPSQHLRGGGPVFRWSYLWALPLLPLAGPIALGCGLHPRCSLPQGSGLTTMIPKTKDGVARDLALTPLPFLRYSNCEGLWRRDNDCLGAKGLLGASLTRKGARIDVYNTHLDAGNTKHDREARRSQIRQLIDFIDAHSKNAAVIVAGDLNSRYRNDEDQCVLKELEMDLGLARAPTLARFAIWGEDLDYIYFRSGKGAQLILEAGEHGEDEGLTYGRVDDDGRKTVWPLSDHPAIFAHFRVVATQ